MANTSTQGVPRTRLLVLGVVVVLSSLGAALRLHGRLAEGEDLKPRPDALEYGTTAARLAAGGSYALSIAGVEYPPRYPPGFAFLAAPIVRICGGRPFDGWKASLVYGVLAIAATALLAHLLAGPLAALAAGLLIALSAAHIESSGLCMSETCSSALWALALLFAALAVRGRSMRPRVAFLLAAAATVGCAGLVRYTNFALLLPLLLFFGTRHRLAPKKRIPLAVLLALPAAAAAAALLSYNARTFGSPLADGYRFWVPTLYGTPLCFSARYALEPGPLAPWTSGNLPVYLKTLAGADGRLLSIPFALLALVGIAGVVAQGRNCPIARLLALASLVAMPAVLAFHLVYYWQDTRFLTPLLPLMAVLCGAGARAVQSALQRVSPRGAPWIVAACVLMLSTPLAADALSRPSAPPSLASRLEGLDRDLARDSIVIVNFPISIARPALGRDRRVIVDDANLSDPHLNAISLYSLFGRDGSQPAACALARSGALDRDVEREIDRGIRDGRHVYLVHASSEGPENPVVGELRRRYDFEDVLFRKPVAVYRLVLARG